MPGTGIRVYVGVDDLAGAGEVVRDGLGFTGSLVDPLGCLIGLWSEK
jgi:hypothetical protein